ncbi:LytTR family DNA-binding domain-containing protein [Blautia coccoides]|uniref:Stage 0 sporulation protein A homolog n=2 Tax=Blautia producta TaxID=33035 RepID=A0A7G5MVS7_9FIRM|nr:MULTISPECIES: LytTR family DNA-binding domain-containing protein [Blautia]MDU5207999.1 LytTR family DNA-binding domain-containing protein [Clostridioides difficile]MDU6869802.1 LytTR family DNA-binding domain-containing protein [Enterococcus faecium]MCR1990109.1 LytTR family DNA-binding domain-containing protein [Blautia coccoides]QIB54203.1 response regulator transcription factor [Blautia producta ATCC 27340 = DSM 2950]QMW78720.1 response regulator transcription factor [Blautia producta]
MRKITIVDDDIVFTKKIKKAIGKYYLEKGRSIEILVYHKTELVLYDVEENKFSDIYLLDIEMPGINGIELATRIKDAYKKSYIIFITSHLQFTLDAFDVKAYQYIPKEQNILIERLYRSLDELEKEIDEGDKYYLVQTNSRYQKVQLREIFYIYKDGKYSVIVTEHEKVFERETLKNIFMHLERSSDGFYMLDRGYIINLMHVMKVDAGNLFMRNSVSIPITKSRIKEAKDAVYGFWKGYLE